MTAPTGKAEHRRAILSIDRGSSSLKVAVFDVGPEDEQLLIDGEIEAIGAPKTSLQIRDHRAVPCRETSRLLGDAAPVAAALASVRDMGVHVKAVGHRLVYGGLEHEAPARVTDRLMTSLQALVKFDPLHLPSALAAVRDVAAALPDVPQVVCFDTAFHHRMPDVAQRLPLPLVLWSEGVRRYGFHGLSYESIVRALGPTGVRGRMIVAHLGSGASAAAIRDGKPVDTTMGFSPLGGLMMGTRPGDLDPGAFLYLLREGRYTIAELDDVLTRRSGLLGVSQTSADMRTLLERRADDSRAANAVELFVYLAKKQIGALVAVLGGIDTIVFTGGIGERSAPIRREIAAGLAHLGVELDPARNAAGAAVISVDGSRVVARMLPAQENRMIVRHTFATLFAAPDDDSGGAFTPARRDATRVVTTPV
jgi:acetate kinase